MSDEDQRRFEAQRMSEWCDEHESQVRQAITCLPVRCPNCPLLNGNAREHERRDYAVRCVHEREPLFCLDPDRPGFLCAGWIVLNLALTRPPSFAEQ